MARPVLPRPDIQVFTEIAAVDLLVTRAMERALPAGLSRPQFNLLARLALTGEQSPGELAGHMVLTKGAVTHLIGRLEARRLVAVSGVAADQRRKRVRLTEAGARVLVEAQGQLKEIAAAMRQALSPEAFSETLPLLSALRAHLSCL